MSRREEARGSRRQAVAQADETRHAETDEEGEHVEAADERPLPRVRHFVAGLRASSPCIRQLDLLTK